MAASVPSTPKKRQRDLSLSSTYHDYRTHKENSDPNIKLSYYLNGAGSINERTPKRLKLLQEKATNLLHQPRQFALAEEEFKNYCVALEFSPKSPRFYELRRFAINCLYVGYGCPDKVADEMDYYEVLSSIMKSRFRRRQRIATNTSIDIHADAKDEYERLLIGEDDDDTESEEDEESEDEEDI